MITALTADHDALFFEGLKSLGVTLRADPKHILCVMQSESGVSAKALNPHGHASGLIQFMPATLKGLGWVHGDEAFRALSSTEQLEWVLAYFAPHRGKLVSVAAIYTATFLPALVANAGNPDFVLTAKAGPLGWAYGPNASFDANKDLAITVRELEQAVTRNCRGPRWVELLARLDGEASERSVEYFPFPLEPDLRTTIGIQFALRKLGFDPGPLDGIPGRLTRGAVISFQLGRGLVGDGIVGPLTKHELLLRLAVA